MHKDIKIMKIKNLLFLVPMLIMSLCLFSCGDDDDNDLNNGDSNGDNTEIKGDYIATTSVKTLTLTIEKGGIGSKSDDERAIYEDFNNLYTLALSGGNICFPHYVRSGGNWSTTASYGDKDKYHGIKDVGKVGSLSNVDSKEKVNDYTISSFNYNRPWYNYSIVQPNHGYAAYFTTENDEIKYMRIFVKDYKLDDAGSLASITIQYQLY